MRGPAVGNKNLSDGRNGEYALNDQPSIVPAMPPRTRTSPAARTLTVGVIAAIIVALGVAFSIKHEHDLDHQAIVVKYDECAGMPNSTAADTSG